MAVSGLELTRRHCPVGVVIFFAVMMAEPVWLATREIPYARVARPVLAVLGYALVAAAIDRRLISVGPEGVEIRVRPLPFGPAIRVPRAAITAVYVRDFFVQTSQEYQYAVGVLEGTRRTDVYAPIESKEMAGKAAADVARILNGAPVVAGDEQHGDSRRVWRVIAWIGLLLAAGAAGALWELRK
jgi:hypothetical protein